MQHDSCFLLSWNPIFNAHTHTHTFCFSTHNHHESILPQRRMLASQLSVMEVVSVKNVLASHYQFIIGPFAWAGATLLRKFSQQHERTTELCDAIELSSCNVNFHLQIGIEYCLTFRWVRHANIMMSHWLITVPNWH